jgi:hypothetical protein
MLLEASVVVVLFSTVRRTGVAIPADLQRSERFPQLLFDRQR